jgi:NAD(P)-dependent dehydrogenase (short-subunit alcohol dehydrogenase family)
MDTKSKVALITGGSRGLGKNMALAIARKGIDLIITYNSNKEAADKVVSEIESLGQKAVAFQLDTSKTNGFDNFVKQTTAYLQEHREVQILIFLLITQELPCMHWPRNFRARVNDIFNIHYKGVFLTQKFLPFINDGGGIINISSGLARLTFPGSSVYASMKGAVEVLTHIWRRN